MRREHLTLRLRPAIPLNLHPALLVQIQLPKPLLDEVKVPRDASDDDLRLQVREFRTRAAARAALVGPEAAFGDRLAGIAEPALGLKVVASGAEDLGVALDGVCAGCYA